jgi:hypothetical protein
MAFEEDGDRDCHAKDYPLCHRDVDPAKEIPLLL